MLLGNARFNMLRLGAIATRYLPDFYGPMADDLNRGERTDRFEVSWVTTSKRVTAAIARGGGAPSAGSADAQAILSARAGDGAAPEPEVTGLRPGERTLVAVPADHLALRREDPSLARRWREAAGEAFRICFELGMIVTGITEDGEYVFERVDPSEVWDDG
jgi:predicted GNAT superfamily acetyltransferase